MEYLPVFIQLRGALAVVVGGGSVAARKVELLLRAGARLKIIAPQIDESLHVLAEHVEVEHVSAIFVPEHLAGATLVVAATDDRAVNAAVSKAARANRIPVNVVDDPELSTFIFPAIVDRSPVIVAVGSSAQSPVLARRVRAQIESL